MKTTLDKHNSLFKRGQMSDISIAALKTELDTEMQSQKERISAYCQDQMKITESHREGYAKHARGTQAKLLVRLRSDILGYTPPPKHGRQEISIRSSSFPPVFSYQPRPLQRLQIRPAYSRGHTRPMSDFIMNTYLVPTD
jgi:hypothetical protein